jgi:hypothetical protein
MKEQGIGEFSTRENHSDFMTDKLVILFPENLLEYCEYFDQVKEVEYHNMFMIFTSPNFRHYAHSEQHLKTRFC